MSAGHIIGLGSKFSLRLSVSQVACEIKLSFGLVGGEEPPKNLPRWRKTWSNSFDGKRERGAVGDGGLSTDGTAEGSGRLWPAFVRVMRTESRLLLVWVFEPFSFFTHCGYCLHHILNFRIITTQERHLFWGKETEKTAWGGVLRWSQTPSLNDCPSPPDKSDHQHWGPSSCSCGLFLIFHNCCLIAASPPFCDPQPINSCHLPSFPQRWISTV